MNIKQFIRRTEKVSLIQWECFKNFPSVLSKNKDSFSSMFDTVNYFLTHGKPDFCGA